MQISSLTNSEIYDNSNRTSNADKIKSDDFESLISSTKTSDETATSKIEEKVIVHKSSIQSLYDDIISLLKTGFTVGELKAFEEKLKQILKMRDDKKTSINEVESALEKLSIEIQEAKKKVTAQTIKKSDEDSVLNEEYAKIELLLKMS
jgi:predicted  nucleic acid-binding Zn-ribbon protein